MNTITGRTTRQIVVCPRCRGTGTTMTPRTPEAHGYAVTCTTCNGHRVVTEITTVSLQPVAQMKADEK